MSLRPEPVSSLTGLRFIAAISVVLAHGLNSMSVQPGFDPFWRVCLSYGAGFGMSTFFVLSGFVIHYNYSDSITENYWRGSANFCIARIARLYPLYIVCLIFGLYDKGYFFNILYGARPTDDLLRENFWSIAPYYLTLTQTWKFSIVGSNSLVYAFPFSDTAPITWSASTELFFYLTYPMVCFACVRLRRVRHTIGCGAIVALAAFASMALLYHFRVAIDHRAVAAFGPIAGTENGFQDSFLRWLFFMAPYARLPEFVLGCLVATLYRQTHSRRPTAAEERIGLVAASLSIFVIGAMIYMVALPEQWLTLLQVLNLNFGFAPPVAVLVFCAARYRNVISAFLAHRTMVRFGEASYSIYLFHIVFITSAGLNALPVGQHAEFTSVVLIRLGVAMAAIIGFSLITYQFIEVPARRVLRRLLTIPPRQRAAQIAPASG